MYAKPFPAAPLPSLYQMCVFQVRDTIALLSIFMVAAAHPSSKKHLVSIGSRLIMLDLVFVAFSIRENDNALMIL